ncbi:hypothetical protein CCUS01_11469 [Colletotrichum cuscutae]|uniref:Uncharacterized protein n=1 Tax=Colletotrichum cuscutae TaxID=1209917 RepID=A0AAI9U4X8_9PEZI|nr:hypothetical protein CCUS01_11469 [Colletotrichum cuscutae]
MPSWISNAITSGRSVQECATIGRISRQLSPLLHPNPCLFLSKTVWPTITGKWPEPRAAGNVPAQTASSRLRRVKSDGSLLKNLSLLLETVFTIKRHSIDDF